MTKEVMNFEGILSNYKFALQECIAENNTLKSLITGDYNKFLQQVKLIVKGKAN
jgi:hypothetical protein